MPTDRTFKVVLGLHRETPIPADVQTLKLAYRTAIVLDTYRSWSSDMVFDSGLFVALLTTIDRSFAPSTLSISMRLYEPERLQTFHDLTELDAFYTAHSADPEIPEEATWTRDGQIIAKGFSERWDLVGGPAPYHDSCTFSVFSRTPLPDTIWTQIRETSLALDAEMTELS
jgi:hypothetical protein